jgi:hypothetical protein
MCPPPRNVLGRDVLDSSVTQIRQRCGEGFGAVVLQQVTKTPRSPPDESDDWLEGVRRTKEDPIRLARMVNEVPWLSSSVPLSRRISFTHVTSTWGSPTCVEQRPVGGGFEPARRVYFTPLPLPTCERLRSTFHYSAPIILPSSLLQTRSPPSAANQTRCKWLRLVWQPTLGRG